MQTRNPSEIGSGTLRVKEEKTREPVPLGRIREASEHELSCV